MKRPFVFLVAAAMSVSAPTPAGAATLKARSHRKPATPRLVVVSASVAPGNLPSGGGRATVTVVVRGATTCWLTELSGNMKASLPKPARCSDGTYRQAVRLGANASDKQAEVKLDLLVAGADGKIVSKYIVISEAGARVAGVTPAKAPPVVLSATALPSEVPSGGGQATVVGTLRNATTCRTVVLNGHGEKVRLPPPSSCSDGMYGASVSFGPATSESPVTVELGLLASGPNGTSARGVFYVVAAGKTSARATPVGGLPSGVKVALTQGGPLLRRTATPSAVRSTSIVVHFGTAVPRGRSVRLVLADFQGVTVATVPPPVGCAQYMASFSKPVPSSTYLSLAISMRPLGGATWVPDGLPTLFNVSRSPVVLTVSQAMGAGSVLAIEERGARSC